MQITDKGGNIDLNKQHTKREKPGTREHVLCDSVHLNLKKKTDTIYGTAWRPAAAQDEGWERAGWKAQEGAVRRWQDSILIPVVVTRVHTCVTTRWHGHPLYTLHLSEVYWNTQKANKQRRSCQTGMRWQRQVLAEATWRCREGQGHHGGRGQAVVQETPWEGRVCPGSSWSG